MKAPANSQMLCWFPKSAWYEHQLRKYFLKPVQLSDILRSAAISAETEPICKSSRVIPPIPLPRVMQLNNLGYFDLGYISRNFHERLQQAYRRYLVSVCSRRCLLAQWTNYNDLSKFTLLGVGAVSSFTAYTLTGKRLILDNFE